MFAASPDGIFRDCLLEIKCPFILQNTVPEDLDALTVDLRRNFCLEKNENGRICLKKQHKYYAQCQLQASTPYPAK